MARLLNCIFVTFLILANLAATAHASCADVSSYPAAGIADSSIYNCSDETDDSDGELHSDSIYPKYASVAACYNSSDNNAEIQTCDCCIAGHHCHHFAALGSENTNIIFSSSHTAQCNISYLHTAKLAYSLAKPPKA